MSRARIAASAFLVLAAPGYSKVVAGSDLSRGDMDNTSPRHLVEYDYQDDTLDPVMARNDNRRNVYNIQCQAFAR